MEKNCKIFARFPQQKNKAVATGLSSLHHL